MRPEMSGPPAWPTRWPEPVPGEEVPAIEPNSDRSDTDPVEPSWPDTGDLCETDEEPVALPED